MALFVVGRRLHPYASGLHHHGIIPASLYVCNSITPKELLSVKVVSQQMTICLVCSAAVFQIVPMSVTGHQFIEAKGHPSNSETPLIVHSILQVTLCRMTCRAAAEQLQMLAG
jgi:hypothetical protein